MLDRAALYLPYPIHEFIRGGYLAVTTFFVLSGFVLARSYAQTRWTGKSLVRYGVGRLARVYPVYVLSLLVVAPFILADQTPGKTPLVAVHGLLLQGWLGHLPVSWNTPAWSLSCEMFFYLSLPIAIASGKVRAWSPTNRIVGLLVLAAVLFAYCAAATGPVRLAMFVAGMLLHELLSVTIWRPAPSLAAISGFAAVLLKVIPTEGSVGFTLKVVALFFGFGLLCWSCLAQPHSWLGLGLSWAPLRWLGNISYSYYLVHGLALQAGFKLATTMLPAAQWGVLGGALLLPATFALSLLPSLLLYLIVERPLSLVPGEQTRRSVDVFPMNVIDDKEPT